MLRRRPVVLVFFLLAHLHSRKDLFVVSSVLNRLHAVVPVDRFHRRSRVIRLLRASAILLCRAHPADLSRRVHHFFAWRVLLQAHARRADPSRGKVLNFAVNQVVSIVVRLGPLLVLFWFVDAIFFEPSAATHLILRQVVVLDDGFGVDEVVHLGHQEILMVSLVIWLSSGPRLPLCLGRPALLRQVVPGGLAPEPTAGQRWPPQLPARLLAHLARKLGRRLTNLAWHQLVLLGVHLLVFGLGGLAGFRGSLLLLLLALPILVLNVRDQALLRAVVGVRVHHGVDRLEMVGLAQWLLLLLLWLVFTMWLLLQVVVSLVVAGGEKLTSGLFAFLVHLSATRRLTSFAAFELRVEENLSLRLNIVFVIGTFFAS